MINDLIQSVVVVGAISVILGIIIGLCSKIFYVEPDARIEQIYELLPHFNCGACGHAGCMPMAEALVAKESVVAGCKPASKEQRIVLQEKLKELDI